MAGLLHPLPMYPLPTYPPSQPPPMFQADGGTRIALQIFEKIPEKKIKGVGFILLKVISKKKFQKNF